MVTKRTPIDRPPRMEITPRAVELWEQMQGLVCTCKPRDWGGAYWEHELCPGCQERTLFRRAIGQELRLPPWDIPYIIDPDAPNPWPAGSLRHARWRPDPDAVARWKALEAASRERQTT